MTLEPRLKEDRRHSVVMAMADAEPTKNVLAAAGELVDRLRGPDGLERFDSPYLAGLAAAARFEPRLDRDILADAYAKLAIAEQEQPQTDTFARDSARLLVNFTRVREAFGVILADPQSESVVRYVAAVQSFPDEPDQIKRMAMVIASDRMLTLEEGITLDRSIVHNANENAFVRPRSSDLAQAEYLFDVFNGHREAFEDPLLSKTVDRDIDIVAASSLLWDRRETFEPSIEKIDMVEALAHAIASREAGKGAADEQVLQDMSFDLMTRSEAKTYLSALESPESAPNLRVLDVAVHADEETIRFFKAMEIGRFDRLDAIDAQMIRNQRDDIANMPSAIADVYPSMPARTEALRERLRTEGSLASVFPPQPTVGQGSDAISADTGLAPKAGQTSIADAQAAFAARSGPGI